MMRPATGSEAGRIAQIAVDRSEAVAEIARQQFEKRRAYLRREVEAGRMAAGEANQRVLPWLAIAAAAGARLSELDYEDHVYRPRRGWEVEQLRLQPHEICERWRDTLARARDAAGQACALGPTPRLESEAAELIALARALRVPARESLPEGIAA